MKSGLGLFLGNLLTCCRHIIVRKHLYWNCVQCGLNENVFVCEVDLLLILDVSQLIYETPQLIT